MLSGWKDFDAGDILTAADLQNYIQNQVVLHFDNTSSRDVAFSVVAPEAGMISYVDTQGFLELYNGTSWDAINIGSPLSGGFPLPEGRAPITTGLSRVASWQQVSQAISPNYIINGAFDIWQRGTSFSFAENAGTYAADRFIGLATSSTPATLTVSRQAFTPGAAPVAGYEASFFYRQALSAAVTSGVNIIRHRVEDVRTLAGQAVTISYWAKANASIQGYAAPFIRQNFGSGGSASVDTTFTNHTYTTSWDRYSSTVTLPNLTGKTIGTNSYLELVITLPTNASSTFDLWGVQLEAGSVATPFKRNAPSLQGELAACQRYYERVDGNGSFFGPGFVNSATLIYGVYTYKVEKRVTPSYSSSSATAVSAFSATTGTVTTTANSAANLSSTKVGVVQATVSGFTGGQGGMLGITTGSFIDFSAEL